MGQRFLIDSNVIIDYTSNLFPEKITSAIDAIINDNFIISIVVKIEVLGFNGQPDKMKMLEQFIQLADVIPLNEDVANRTIELRKKHKKLALADAVIAATASVYGFTILTRNIVDFSNIRKLKVVNPYDL